MKRFRWSESKRHSTAALVSAALLVPVGLGLTACGGEAKAEPGGSATYVVPASEPPDLVEYWVTKATDASLVNIYSKNWPVVVVCTGEVAQCRSLNGDSPVLRTTRVSGRNATVMIGGTDRPGEPAPAQPTAFRQYWLSADLTLDEPEWLKNR